MSDGGRTTQLRDRPAYACTCENSIDVDADRLGLAGRMQSVGRMFGRWLDMDYMQIAFGAGDAEPPRIGK